MHRDHGVDAHRPLEVLGRVDREQLAVVDDREPVAELVGLLHVVRGEQDRLAVGVELAEDLPERDAALRVEAGGRLVEEEDRGSVHDRPRHHQPLRHAAREREHIGAAAVGEPELVEQAGGLGLRRLRAHPEEPAVEVEVLVDARASGRACSSAARRRSAASPRSGARPRRRRRRSRRPDVGITRVVSMPGGRGLARTVRTEQTEDLARVHLEVEGVHCHDVARVHLGELLGANHHVGHRLATYPRATRVLRE